MRRIIFVVVLATAIASPAAAHIPQRCDGKRAMLDLAHAEFTSAYEALDSASEEEGYDVMMEFILSLRSIIEASRDLVECADSDP